MKANQTWDQHLNNGPKAILPSLRKQTRITIQNWTQYGGEGKIEFGKLLNFEQDDIYDLYMGEYSRITE